MACRTTHTSKCIYSFILFVNVNTRNDSCVPAATHIFDCFVVVLDNFYGAEKSPPQTWLDSKASLSLFIYINLYSSLSLSQSISLSLTHSRKLTRCSLYVWCVCVCYCITSNDTYIWDIICLPKLKECSEKIPCQFDPNHIHHPRTWL